MKYAQVYSGEWVQPVRKGYKMGCCDCGLVHLAERNTAAHRRNPKFKFKKAS